MPFAFNGCGTRYYGERDKGEDGSHITTLFVSFVWIPILPLASYRVISTGEGINVLVYKSDSYMTQRIPLCWRQVRNVYLWASPFILVALYLTWKG